MPPSKTSGSRKARPPAQYLQKQARSSKAAAPPKTRGNLRSSGKVREEVEVEKDLTEEDEDEDDDTASVDPADKYKPTEAEFKKFKVYRAFQLENPDGKGNGIKFWVGDRVIVLPEGVKRTKKDPHDDKMWFGTIEDIRASPSKQVWCHVRWFYRPDEFQDVIFKKRKNREPLLKSFDQEACGHWELMLSTHKDFVETISVDGKFDVVRYDEGDVDQSQIPADTYYWRSEYMMPLTAKAKGKYKPPQFSCVCKEVYAPDDIAGTMRYCPRSSCRRWFHEDCLAEYECTAAQYDRVLERSLPDLVEDNELSTPSPKRRRLTKGSPSRSNKHDYDALDAPKLLLAVARTPIVRGGPFGVVGNARTVLGARKMLFRLAENEEFDDEWEDRTDVKDWETIGKKKGPPGSSKGEMARRRDARVCKNCGHVI